MNQAEHLSFMSSIETHRMSVDLLKTGRLTAR